MKNVKFGFCIPIFANPGMLFFRTPNYKKLDWESIKKTVLKCEKLGYDSLFVADHLFLGNKGEIWECLSTMSALSAITNKIEIIPIHLCNNFRHPGVVAKSFATMSHISNGRTSLFYDYGWRKAEFDNYGIDFGKTDKQRIQKMSEGLAIIKGMLENEKFTFNGQYYKIKNAICTPKPIKKIPIWMGETNNNEMVKNIVKYADVFNSMPCSIEGLKKKLDAIKKECKKQKRDFSKISLSLETQVLIRETDDEIKQCISNMKKLRRYNNSHDNDIIAQLKATNPELNDYDSLENLKKEFLIGTPEKIRDKIDSYIKEDIDHFMLWFMDYPDSKGMELFAKKVFPTYKKMR